MKTNIKKLAQKPIHLHIEHISRLRVCLIVAAGLLTLALIKADSRMMGVIREAYAEGSGHLGSYLRQETVHPAATLHVSRSTTTSGQ